jgi:hypothetical protein
MEDKELKNIDIGAELDLKIELKDNKLCVGLVYDGKGLDGGVTIMVEPGYFLEKLAAAIPGGVDDAVIAVLRGAFKI